MKLDLLKYKLIKILKILKIIRKNNLNNIYCTLQDSIELCNIQSVNKYGKPYLKYPKLVELHQKLFQTTPNNLHNAFNDILVTLRCYIKMRFDRDIKNDCQNFICNVETLQVM